MMKEILTLLGRYNQTANRQLFGVLDSQPNELLTKETGSYFTSILGILNHILVSDLNWFSAFRDGNLDLPELNSPVLDFEHPGWAQPLYTDLDTLKNHREQLDELIVLFTQNTSEAVFSGPIEVTRSGTRQRHSFPFGQVLTHVFNHQTHHRGAISEILDQGSVENDYSNILYLLTEGQ